MQGLEKSTDYEGQQSNGFDTKRTWLSAFQPQEHFRRTKRADGQGGTTGGSGKFRRHVLILKAWTLVNGSSRGFCDQFLTTDLLDSLYKVYQLAVDRRGAGVSRMTQTYTSNCVTAALETSISGLLIISMTD